jgi:hypothetical protein
MCLSGNPIDLNRLPKNFKVQNFNPELETYDNPETPDENTAETSAA